MFSDLVEALVLFDNIQQPASDGWEFVIKNVANEAVIKGFKIIEKQN